MTYTDSATHRLTKLCTESDRLCDVMIGDTFRTVPSIGSGRSTSSTFADVVAVEDFRINGQSFVEITTRSGDSFTASAWTPVEIAGE